MTDESTIQCENCGTIFSDLEEVCPYCGQPRPPLADDEFYYQDDWGDLPPEEPEDLLDDEDYADYPEDEPLDEEYLDEGYLPADSADLLAQPFEDDDIFAIAEPEEYLADEETYDEYVDEPQYDDGYDPAVEAFDEYDEPAKDEEFEEEEIAPRRFTRRRLVVGCLGIFLCAGLFYGGIGLLGAYHGLQERTLQTQTEAEAHYQRGQEHLINDSLELAIAEFELALSLNPNLLAAREALRDAQRAALAQPTPTSETRSAAAESILTNAQAQLAQENWTEAVETLAQVRDLDPDFQVERVSELIYTANYNLGLQLLRPDRLEEAVLAFEAALSERPDNAEVTLELTKALLYLDGKNAEHEDLEAAVEAFSQLYREDATYFDVKQRLFEVHEAWGDELFNQQEWCEAEAQFIEASLLQPSVDLTTKTDLSSQRCQGSPPGATQTTGPTPKPQAQATRATGSASTLDTGVATPTIISATTADSGGASRGKIFFSAYNPAETRWEILSIPASGGTPEFVVANGTMPAVSPNGRLLVYRSEAIESMGFHIFDLTSQEDNRITIFIQHVLPRWGGDNNQFLFSAQEPTTKLWKVQQGFADGKGDPVILRDGRTPDWSSDNRRIAYQGTDPQGNDPGIYIVPFGGGEATRLTNHESDRSPDFSPDGTQLAYMSTRGGDWDIYTISTAGSAPRQITTSPGNDGLPAWSPDGSRIAYVSDTGGSWAIYTISADGGTPAKVAEWDGLNRPDWLMAQIWWAR